MTTIWNPVQDGTEGWSRLVDNNIKLENSGNLLLESGDLLLQEQFFETVWSIIEQNDETWSNV